MLSKPLFNLALAAYINVLCFRSVRATCTKLSVMLRTLGFGVSHDALQRLLHSQQLWNQILRQRYAHLLLGRRGRLIIDDTVIAKPFSHQLDLLGRYWSSSDKRYLTGISCVLLIWTDGHTRVPIGIRFYRKGSGISKLDLAIELLQEAKNLWKPSVDYVLFDSWYAATKVLKSVTALGWHWCTRLKSNRNVNGHRRIDEFFRFRFGHALVSLHGRIHALVLKHTVLRRGRAEVFFLGSSDRTLSVKKLKRLYKQRQWIEETIKILKSHLSIEGCAARSTQAYTAHVYLCLMAFAQLERYRLKLGFKTIYQLRDRLANLPIPCTLRWKLPAALAA